MIPVPRSATDDADPDSTNPDSTNPDGTDPDGGLARATVDDLRRQRSMLAEELRGVRYWRRIARAQTDLLVASLLHAGRADLDGLHGLGARGARDGTFDPCDRLLQLRERNRLMAGYERSLRDDHDAVTRELADRVAGVSARSVQDASPTAGAS